MLSSLLQDNTVKRISMYHTIKTFSTKTIKCFLATQTKNQHNQQHFSGATGFASVKCNWGLKLGLGVEMQRGQI
ncbi:MAG: hypothetical protein COA78_20995 [Blastopirellula sp.]|nr:MAG: hypothetical protein COA78_20995 [Blastopirellula sp.]